MKIYLINFKIYLYNLINDTNNIYFINMVNYYWWN